MHHKKIVHRDIKLDNILINEISKGEYDVKIADFGLATFMPDNKDDKLTEKCGTPCYVAPEILRGHPYDFKCDSFSLGSMLFNLVTGRYLFNGENKDELLKKNLVCDMTNAKVFIKSAVSEKLGDLIVNLLEPNPEKRLSVREALGHPFFN